MHIVYDSIEFYYMDVALCNYALAQLHINLRKYDVFLDVKLSKT